MMRYYFHILHRDGQIDDTEGTVFDSLDLAKEEAQLTLQELVAEALVRGKNLFILTGVKICTDDAELAVIMVDPAIEGVLAQRVRR